MPATRSAMATPTRNGGPSGSPGDAHQPAFGLHHRVVPSLVPPRTGLPESGDRCVDQLRPRLFQRRIVESEPRQRARPEVLDEDVGRVEEAIDDASPVRLLEVERDAFLVAIVPRKYALSPPTNGGPHARVSSPSPGRSTLMTRAPMSASIIVQYGPDSTRVRSRTVMPLRGPLGGMRPPFYDSQPEPGVWRQNLCRRRDT